MSRAQKRSNKKKKAKPIKKIQKVNGKGNVGQIGALIPIGWMITSVMVYKRFPKRCWKSLDSCNHKIKFAIPVEFINEIQHPNWQMLLPPALQMRMVIQLRKSLTNIELRVKMKMFMICAQMKAINEVLGKKNWSKCSMTSKQSFNP